ncbi:MAG TPA: DUF5667 domain-containing protein [Amycolatopsis sp.]|nr:DUF5667 domain-containing protein [Amycolatopsis sp.]
MNESGRSARELEIVSRLRELGASATLDAETRDRLRDQIGRRLAEPTPSRRRHILANVLAAAVALMIVLGGFGVALSGDSLPGEPLYGLKRATESAESGLTFGADAKATRHLRVAATRLDEVIALRSENRSAMADFQREVRAGTAGLTALGVAGAGGELDTLAAWAHRQILKRAPFADVNTLLARIDSRARALSARLDCYQITSGASDDLGVVPAGGACLPPPGLVGAPVPAAPAAPAPRAPAVTGSDATRSSESVATATPTPPVPPSDGPCAPTAINAPIFAPTSPRAPGGGAAPAPVVWVPPLFPG